MGVRWMVGMADGQIKAFGGQRAQPVRQVQLDTHQGVITQEVRQMRHDLLACERHRGRHTQQALGAAGQIPHLHEALLNLLERRARLIDQTLPRLGQAHASGGPLHQCDAGQALQFGNALAHCRLAHAQPRCGSGVAALLRQGDQPVHMAPEFLLMGVFHGIDCSLF